MVLSRLTEGEVFVSKAPGANIPTNANEVVTEFAGKHPAGLVGTHIHFLKPVGADKICMALKLPRRYRVWSVFYNR